MAIAGDVIIKLAADFASFVSGMNEATDKMEKFASKSAETGTQVERFIGNVKTAFKALAIEEVTRAFINYNEALQKNAAALQTQAQSYGLTTDQLQAYQYAAIVSGQTTEAMVTSIAKFNIAIGEAARGSKTHIDTLNQLGVKILDGNGKLRNQADLLQEVAQKLLKLPEGAQRAAIELDLFGKSGQAVNPMLQQMAQGLDTLLAKARAAGVVLGVETIEQMDKATREADLAAKKFEVLATVLSAETYQPAKHWFLSVVNDLLEDTIADFKVMEGYSGIIDKLLALAKLEGQKALPSDAKLNPVAVWEADLAKLDKQAAEVTAKYNAAAQSASQAAASDMSVYITQLRDIRAQREALTNQIQAYGVPETKMPTITTTGKGQPGVAGAGDEAEAQIKRLNAQAAAAKKAYQDLLAGYNQPLEEINRSVELQKQIDDMVAKLTASQKAAGYEDRIRAAATAADTARSNFALLQKAEADADTTERKLGDGSAAYAKILLDLNRALGTHRLTTEAYNRALKEQTEAQQQATLAAKRYDDNIGSLTAGFQNAADQYARANDLYTVGAQTFSGLTTAMGEGLDALSGKSTKTFGQIVSDFASMLEKLALQAAVSQVFKLLFGSATTSTGGVAPSDWFAIMGNTGFTPKATGGPVYPGQSYLVGEQGPERFVPTVAGAIVPNSALGSSPGVTVNVDMSGSAPPSMQSTADFARRLKQAVVDTIQNEQRPGGTLYAGAR